IRWGSDRDLLAAGVTPWTGLPMWAPDIPEFAGIWDVAGDRALRTGMRYRPLSDTVHDTWLWLKHEAAAGQARTPGASLLAAAAARANPGGGRGPGAHPVCQPVEPALGPAPQPHPPRHDRLPRAPPPARPPRAAGQVQAAPPATTAHGRATESHGHEAAGVPGASLPGLTLRVPLGSLLRANTSGSRGRYPGLTLQVPVGWLPRVTLPSVSDRDDLLKVINDKAVVRGDFVLSSGQRTSWYIDLRRVLLSGASAALAGRVMLAVTADLDYDAVGGLTLGADPVAAAMMHAGFVQGKNLDAFVGRKSEKAHGLQRRVAGPHHAARRGLARRD